MGRAMANKGYILTLLCSCYRPARCDSVKESLMWLGSVRGKAPVISRACPQAATFAPANERNEDGSRRPTVYASTGGNCYKRHEEN